MRINAVLRRIILLSLFMTIFPYVSFSDNKTFEKVALIIGNNDYRGKKFMPLETCVNDAEQMDLCLSKLGYETIIVKDATRQEMIDKITEFESIISNGAEVGIFYYSGHGFNMGGSQYLVPAKTDIPKSSASLRNRCYDLSEIESLLLDKCKYSFLFIDACRVSELMDNKSATGWAESSVELDVTKNQQIRCFASENNTVAHSGFDRLSPFTKILSLHLFDEEDFKYVWTKRIKPEVQSLYKQKPVCEDDTYESFYFNPGGKIESIYTSTMSNTSNKGIKLITFNTNPVSKIQIKDKYYESGATIEVKNGSRYVYTIEHDGYEPYSGVLQVDSLTPSVIDINLTKIQEAWFTVVCEKPQKAHVYLDGTYKGDTPITIVTTNGMHDLQITADKYYGVASRVNLNPGINDIYYECLSKEIPEFFDFDKYRSSTHQVNYHFSPDYQIGLSYMYGFDDSRFYVGAMIASSLGFYKDLSIDQTIIIQNSNLEFSNSITITDGSGEVISATKKTETIRPKTYSSEIDPNNEAKHFDANFLALANCGFSACNGIMLEAGVGAAYHQNRHYMANAYNIEKTTITNNLTGELVEEPTLKYTKSGEEKWYRDKAQWSPAMRLGARFYIPLKGYFDDSCFSIGGGYTYLPTNNQFSSWDVSIGFTWTL